MLKLTAKDSKIILINVLTNSIQYTEEGEIDLTVSLKSVDAENINLTLKIIYTGLGMDEKTQKVIFSAFTQGNISTTKEIQGTGLGLSLTRRICNLMGGDIGGKSEMGQGSTFTISLKMKRINKEVENLVSTFNTSIEKLECADFSHLNILVVEDNLVNPKTY